MLIILIIALLALAGYKIAESKNRDPWVGVLLGGGLGLLGLIILACLSKKEEA